MTYRENATTELHLSDRQIEWIEKISSVADVRAYLQGRDPGHEEAADAVVFSYGAGCLASNVVGSWMVLAGELAITMPSLSFLGLSLVLGITGLRRYTRRRKQFDRRFEIVTFVPTFERRIVGDDPDARSVTFVDVGRHRRVWPERLESLRVSLGQDEQIRACIIHAFGRSYVEWAFPV